ncbi:YTDC2 helicase, partial [Pitta sordida]|nr:YTDC2 helicase [Pitta sordida]
VHFLQQTIDAMDAGEDLTELGYHLPELPVEPHLGKMVLCGVVLKCLDPVLTIACALACRDAFVLPSAASQKRAALLCRKRFAAGTFSDHMAVLRAFQVLVLPRQHITPQSKWCTSPVGWMLDRLSQIRANVARYCPLLASGFVRARGGADIRDVNTNSENWAVIKAALVAGAYPHVVHVDRENLVLTEAKEKKVRFHPTSVLSQAQFKKV